MALETVEGIWRWIAITLLVPTLLWLLRIVGGGHLAQIKSITARLDHVEKNHVPRDEFNSTIETIRKKIDDGNAGTHERLDKMLMMLVNRGDNKHD